MGRQNSLKKQDNHYRALCFLWENNNTKIEFIILIELSLCTLNKKLKTSPFLIVCRPAKKVHESKIIRPSWRSGSHNDCLVLVGDGREPVPRDADQAGGRRQPVCPAQHQPQRVQKSPENGEPWLIVYLWDISLFYLFPHFLPCSYPYFLFGPKIHDSAAWDHEVCEMVRLSLQLWIATVCAIGTGQ